MPPKELRSLYPLGTRLVLAAMDDPQAPPIGTAGTVRGIDDAGQILMAWDTGGSSKRSCCLLFWKSKKCGFFHAICGRRCERWHREIEDPNLRR